MTLEPAELANARADAEELLPDTGYVLACAAGSDGAGGQEESFLKGDSTPCAIAPFSRTRSGGEGGTAGDRIDSRTTHFITLPALTTVTEADRIEIDGQGTFEVLAVRKRSEELTRRVEARGAF